MPTLFRDYESRSTIGIKHVGAWRYATHAGTDVLCCGYAVDSGPVKLWLPGDPVPGEFIEAALNTDWLVSAFNDQFERWIEIHIMGPRHGWRTIPIERHRCSQAAALALSLPATLEKVASALGLEHQKDKAGHKNMLAMSKPRKPRKDEPEGLYWHDSPERFEQLYAYCRQDVETERAINARIGHLNSEEQRVWVLDAKINDRGVYIDDVLATAAIHTAEAAHEKLNTELQTLTEGAVTSIDQTQKLIDWLSAHDCGVDDVQKETLRRALTRKNVPPEARRVMELRLDGAHAAANKFETMMAWRNPDGRIRGALKYHGCSTGRWSSLGVQLQNMKRPIVNDVGAAIEAVATGDVNHLKSLYPQPMSVVGDIVRATIRARPGYRFIIADFSGIESRVLAFLSGQQSKLDQWAKFDHTGDPKDEPYLILGLACGLSSDQARGKGKTADLAFGYMGSVGAWRKLAGDHDPSTDEEIKSYQQAWHKEHPATKKFWGAINHAAVKAVQERGKTIKVNAHISFRCDDDFLRMRLPNGRKLAYPFPRLKTTDRGDCVVVYMDNDKGKWVECRGGQGAYGGTWTENATQAASRDLLAAAMPRLEAAGYPIVLHVHDEIVAEMPHGIGSEDEFLRIITSELPDWSAGLPVAAKGDERDRFCKIVADQSKAKEADDPPWDVTHDYQERDSAMYEESRERAEEDHYSPSERPRGRNSATYIYKDANGEPYQRATRTTTKKFLQARWENGKWVPKAPKVKIPYRLPELIAEPNAPAFICEGEKDADNVADLGLIATTNPGGGIPKAWSSDLNKWFAGRQIFILEDNDATGRNHANEVARALKGIAAEIHIAEFHDLPEHGDVSDWIEQGHSKEELLDRTKKGRIPRQGYTLVRAIDVVPRAPDYLWEGHLARGALELLTGVPGVGKSQIQCGYTACTTTGGTWPNGTNGGQPRNVIMMTAEDVLDQTLIPRLIAAGADLDRVHILKSIHRDDKDRMFLLAEDLDELENVIIDIGDVGLVCIDPITAYMGGAIDSHRATDVRSILSPLKDLAERMGVPFSAITHPAKNASQRALDHFIGSQAYIAVARLGHSCVDEMEEDATGLRQLSGRALFTNPKNTLGPRMPTLAYRITETTISPLGKDITVSKIVWEEVVDVTADQALADANSSAKRQRHNPVTFLMTILANGPVLKKIIEAEATKQGISLDQLRRAREKMGLTVYRRKGQVAGGALWSKPQDAPPEEERE